MKQIDKLTNITVRNITVIRVLIYHVTFNDIFKLNKCYITDSINDIT